MPRSDLQGLMATVSLDCPQVLTMHDAGTILPEPAPHFGFLTYAQLAREESLLIMSPLQNRSKFRRLHNFTGKTSAAAPHFL